MVRIFASSNLILELFVNRPAHIEIFDELLSILRSQKLVIYFTDKCLDDVNFYLSKRSNWLANTAVGFLKNYFEKTIKEVTDPIMREARYLPIKDYSCAIDIICALEENCDAIVTLTPELYNTNKIKVLTLSQLVNIYELVDLTLRQLIDIYKLVARYQLELLFEFSGNNNSYIPDFKRERFKNYDLRGEDLSGQILQGLDLSGANLEGVNFSHADLRFVDFREANLRNVNFSYANLQGANFNLSDLRFALMKFGYFVGASFDSANLSYINCPNANLKKADFTNSNLTSANLTNSCLNGAKLLRSNLQNSIFTNVDMRNIDLCNVRFYTNKFKNARFGNNFGLCSMLMWYLIGNGGYFE